MNNLTRYTALPAIVVAGLAGVGLWWFFADDAPGAVDLTTATETVVDDTVNDGSDGDDADIGPTDLAGSWVVDPETADVDDESGHHRRLRRHRRHPHRRHDDDHHQRLPPR